MVELLSGHYRLDWASYSDREANLMRTGVLDDFKITIELAWKTMKDWLRDERAIIANSPREVIKEAWGQGLVVDGEAWLSMLVRRNELAHTYDKDAARESFLTIGTHCLPLLNELAAVLERRMGNG